MPRYALLGSSRGWAISSHPNTCFAVKPFLRYRMGASHPAGPSCGGPWAIRTEGDLHQPLLLQAWGVMLQRKTSFEALLDSFDADAPMHWSLKGKSLPYGRLQWEMEHALGCTIYDDDCIVSSSSGAAVRQPGVLQFFDSLTAEVRRVDR